MILISKINLDYYTFKVIWLPLLLGLWNWPGISFLEWSLFLSASLEKLTTTFLAALRGDSVPDPSTGSWLTDSAPLLFSSFQPLFFFFCLFKYKKKKSVFWSITCRKKNGKKYQREHTLWAYSQQGLKHHSTPEMSSFPLPGIFLLLSPKVTTLISKMD